MPPSRNSRSTATLLNEAERSLQRHGVFSYHALRTISAQPAISFNALITAVTPPIAASYPQNPVLLGDNSRFSGRIFN